MIYFTSDWHIGHNKPFCYEPRGFSSPEEMDTAILERTNEIVGPGDTLWILGDLAMSKNTEEWNRVFHSLRTWDVHFIRGNHDTDYKIDLYENDYGMTPHGYADVFKLSKKKSFYLSHYPSIVSNYDDEGKFKWNLSGHTHFKTKFYNDIFKIYNVSVDAHNCYPVSIEKIISDIEEREKEIVREK